MDDELRSLLDDVREYLDRFKDYRLIVGPPHKNDAWELMDRIDALRAADAAGESQEAASAVLGVVPDAGP